MKKFTVEQYQEAKVVAKELGINFVGKTKQVLVDMVNEELTKKEQNKTQKKEKWHENGYGFNPGDVVVIEHKVIEKNGVEKEILQGRKASILGPSVNEGFVKALLFDEKTGKLLNCPITLDITKINKEVTTLIVAA